MFSYILTSASRCKASQVRHRTARPLRLVHCTIRLRTRVSKALLEMEVMNSLNEISIFVPEARRDIVSSTESKSVHHPSLFTSNDGQSGLLRQQLVAAICLLDEKPQV